MSDQTHAVSNEGDINVRSEQITGKIIAPGHGNQIINLEINLGGKDMLAQIEALLDIKRQYDQAGLKADIATPAPPVQIVDGKDQPSFQSIDLSASLHGSQPANLPMQAEKAEQMAKSEPAINQIFRIIDRMAGPNAQAVQEIQVQGKTVKLVELNLQRGNLALWRFRRANARLFGGQSAALLTARSEWPATPEMQAFTLQARANLDMLRGWMLVESIAPQRPDLVMPVMNQLQQGLWRQVLDDWASRKIFDDEVIQGSRVQLEAVGETYRPEEVRTAASEAEGNFAEALKRDPQNTVALVNLGIIKAESALFFYIETGLVDRAALQQAHDLFDQARELLKQRGDRNGRVALGKCLIYAATSLPPQASLEAVHWAAIQVNALRSSLPQHAQRAINWEVVQRDLARRDPGFFQPDVVRQARGLFSDAGETALAEQCARTLQVVEQFSQMLPRQLHLMQTSSPIVGTWSYQGQSMLASVNGVLVFDAGGGIHLNINTQNMMGLQSGFIMGGYQVMGNIIVVQGQRLLTPIQFAGMSAMPEPYVDRFMIQKYSETQLILMTQTEGIQLFCQRM